MHTSRIYKLDRSIRSSRATLVFIVYLFHLFCIHHALVRATYSFLAQTLPNNFHGAIDGPKQCQFNEEPAFNIMKL